MIKLAFDLVECCLEFTNPLTYGYIVTAHTQTEPHPMLLNDAQAQALYKAIQALNEGGGQLLTASFDAFALGEAIIDVYTHTDDRIELPPM